MYVCTYIVIITNNHNNKKSKVIFGSYLSISEYAMVYTFSNRVFFVLDCLFELFI